MRFLHTSDLHLGITLFGKSMEAAQRQLDDIILTAARANNCKALLIAGDIFDDGVSNAETITMYGELITHLASELTVIISAGNHDSAARLTQYRELLSKSGVYITGRLCDCTEPIELENCHIYPIPFHRGSEVKDLIGDIGNCHPTVAFTNYLKERLDPNFVNIALAHCYVEGGVTVGSDMAAQHMIGRLDKAPAAAFDIFDYTALGHIHGFQRLTDKMYYSGTPFKYSLSEIRNGRTNKFIIFDSDTREISTVPVPQPIAMRHERGRKDDILKKAAENPSDDYIYVTLTDSIVTSDILRQLSQHWTNILRCEGVMISASGGARSIALNEDGKIKDVNSLLIDFVRDMAKREPTENEKGWFTEAMRRMAERREE